MNTLQQIVVEQKLAEALYRKQMQMQISCLWGVLCNS